MKSGLFIFLLLIGSNVMAAKTPLIVGVWKDGASVWIVRPDGTAFNNAHRVIEGRWKAANKTGYDFLFHWQDGAISQVRVNKDRKTFSGFDAPSQTRWQMVRDSYPPPEKATKKKPAKPVKKQPARQNKTKVRIPRDAVKYKGHYYMVVESPSTPGVAKQQCIEVGGHLARIQSEAEQQFLWRLIQNGRWDLYYVDGSDEASEGRWIFSNGKPMRYFAWLGGEPNNYPGWGIDRRSNIGEHFVCLVKSDDMGRWYDINGSIRTGFICEWDTTNRGAKVEDVVEEREKLEVELDPFPLDDEPQEEPLEPFSFDDDPVENEANLPPPTDPEGILDRAGLYEGRPGVWYLKRANNFAARTYEQLSKSSEIRSALRAVNGRLPTKAEMNNPPSRR